MELSSVNRKSSGKSLLGECRDIQDIRNKIIHQGLQCSADEAELSRLVAIGVFETIVRPVLYSIDLTVVEHGEINAI